MTPADAFRRKSLMLQSWRPHPEVLNLCSPLPAGSVGIHIRRTDHIRTIAHTPLVLYIRAIRQELIRNHNTVFFLSTDCHQSRLWIREQFPTADIRETDGPESTRKSVDDIRRALADMIMLSRCARIIGQRASSFCLMAAWMGQIPLHSLYLRGTSDNWSAPPWYGNHICWNRNSHSWASKPGVSTPLFRLAMTHFDWVRSKTRQLGPWHRGTTTVYDSHG